jgi:hypothetical protein
MEQEGDMRKDDKYKTDENKLKLREDNNEGPKDDGS